MTSIISSISYKEMMVITDLGIDDCAALFFLLNKTDVVVKGIIISGTGLVHAEWGRRNLTQILQIVNQKNIPVALGRDCPLQGDHIFPEAWRTETDQLFQDREEYLSDAESNSLKAIDLITQTLEDSAKLTVLSLGPMTDLAEALRRTPALVNKIEVYVMGGAFRVEGNASALQNGNSSAECNVFIDPTAAREVLMMKASVSWVPLDITNKAPLNAAFLDQFAEQAFSLSAKCLLKLFNQVKDFIASGNCYFWDPLAAAIAADPSLADFETQKMEIITEGAECGRTIFKEEGYSVRIAKSIDYKRFIDIFVETVNISRVHSLIGKSHSTPKDSLDS
jgi:inosine-uridine nucleoside N-ribohydrolase